MQLQA